MHGLFAALTLPLLLFGLAAAQTAPEWKGETLRGAVRSVNSSQTVEVVDEVSQAERRTQPLGHVAYDTKGKEAEQSLYDDYGFLVGKEVYTRDAAGNLSESILSDPEGAVMDRQVYAYAGGKLARIVHYDGKGNARLTEVSAYDGDGRLHEVAYHHGKDSAKTAYRYDGKGRVSETAFYLADGSGAIAPIGPCLGAHRVTYAYDDLGRPIRAVSYEPDGKVNKDWRYSYGSNGLVTEETREDAYARLTFAYTYEYDALGNWIKRIATVSDQPPPGRLIEDDRSRPGKRRIIISRKITYY